MLGSSVRAQTCTGSSSHDVASLLHNAEIAYEQWREEGREEGREGGREGGRRKEGEEEECNHFTR